LGPTLTAKGQQLLTGGPNCKSQYPHLYFFTLATGGHSLLTPHPLGVSFLALAMIRPPHFLNREYAPGRNRPSYSQHADVRGVFTQNALKWPPLQPEEQVRAVPPSKWRQAQAQDRSDTGTCAPANSHPFTYYIEVPVTYYQGHRCRILLFTYYTRR